jgi:hypothetical protein
MTQEEMENKILNYMRNEIPKGRFEFTIPELAEGTKWSYVEVDKAIAVLKSRNLIDSNKKGKRKIPYYYLMELKERCKEWFCKEIPRK